MIADIEIQLNQKIVDYTSISGGDVCESFIIITDEKKKYFVKSYPEITKMFFKEARGLEEIQKTKVMKTPRVILVNFTFLVLEYIENREDLRSPHFWQVFGRKLAELHRVSSEYWGFEDNNFIGRTRQQNTPLKTADDFSNWVDFFWTERIEFQMNSLSQKNLLSKEIQSLILKLEKRVKVFLQSSLEPSALLHGDLWGGNFLTTQESEPLLIDPAVYYGHREADIAMTKLFGGFSEDFYISYNKEWPLKEGWQDRIKVYQLYHLLNHMNLFGKTYEASILKTLKSILK